MKIKILRTTTVLVLLFLAVMAHPQKKPIDPLQQKKATPAPAGKKPAATKHVTGKTGEANSKENKPKGIK